MRHNSFCVRKIIKISPGASRAVNRGTVTGHQRVLQEDDGGVQGDDGDANLRRTNAKEIDFKAVGGGKGKGRATMKAEDSTRIATKYPLSPQVRLSM